MQAIEMVVHGGQSVAQSGHIVMQTDRTAVPAIASSPQASRRGMHCRERPVQSRRRAEQRDEFVVHGVERRVAPDELPCTREDFHISRP
jgi:hypothetical protein